MQGLTVDGCREEAEAASCAAANRDLCLGILVGNNGKSVNVAGVFLPLHPAVSACSVHRAAEEAG